MVKIMPRPPKPIKRQAARPLIPINWEKVDKFLEAGSTGVQIAALIGMHPETLYDRCAREKGVGFTEYRSEKLEKGNSQLLGIQYKLAMQGDKAMLIWLGKNRLNQSDKKKIDHTTNGKCVGQIFLPLKDADD